MESPNLSSAPARAVPARAGELPQAAPAVDEDRAGKLFPELFKNIDPEKRLRVLEVGRARPDTVDFFARFKCRLHFADLYSQPFVLAEQKSLSEPELQARFRQALDFPPGTKLDICLFWDFMQYLTAPAVRAICDALQPYVHEDSRAHSFGVHSSVTRMERVEYGVRDLRRFRAARGSPPALEYRPHPQAELSELMTIFRIDRALLLADGRVEMLLRAEPYWTLG